MTAYQNLLIPLIVIFGDHLQHCKHQPCIPGQAAQSEARRTIEKITGVRRRAFPAVRSLPQSIDRQPSLASLLGITGA